MDNFVNVGYKEHDLSCTHIILRIILSCTLLWFCDFFTFRILCSKLFFENISKTVGFLRKAVFIHFVANLFSFQENFKFCKSVSSSAENTQFHFFASVFIFVLKVDSYESGADESEELFMTQSAPIVELARLTGLNKRPKKSGGAGNIRGERKKKTAMTQSKATTTPLIRSVFEECFSDQIDNDGDGEEKTLLRRQRCGACEKCLAQDCGNCVNCKDMVKFGGSGKSKQACKGRHCENKSLKDEVAVESDEDKENDSNVDLKQKFKIKDCFIKLNKAATAGSLNSSRIKWVGSSLKTESGKAYYDQVEVGRETWSVNDFVYGSDGAICRIVNLFEKNGKPFAHLQEYILGTNTVLSETSDKREIFELISCYNSQLERISGLTCVTYWPIPEDWALIGGTEEANAKPPQHPVKVKSYFYRMSYCPETARFESAHPPVKSLDRCQVCEENKARNAKGLVIPFDCLTDSETASKNWRGFVYEGGVKHCVGDAVFLVPKTKTSDDVFAGLKRFPETESRVTSDKNDPKKYPEYYRKNAYVKGSNENTLHPLDIGIITEIFSRPGSAGNVRVAVRMLYRPHQVDVTAASCFSKDLNLVYWSDDLRTVGAVDVVGKMLRQSGLLHQRSHQSMDQPRPIPVLLRRRL